MFRCTITTQNYVFEPIWTCQSEPDGYECKALPEIKEDGLTPEQVVDPILSVFLNTILKTPGVESISLKTVYHRDNWPEAWGGERTVKNLTYEKQPQNSSEELHTIKISLNARDTLTKVPTPWQEIKKLFSDFSVDKSFKTLNIEITTRKN